MRYFLILLFALSGSILGISHPSIAANLDFSHSSTSSLESNFLSSSPPTYLGVATNGAAYSLEAAYQNGSISRLGNATDKFVIGTKLNGISISGKSINLIIDQLNDTSISDWPVSEFNFRIFAEQISSKNVDTIATPIKDFIEVYAADGRDDAILFTSGSANLQYIKTTQITLNAIEKKIIGNECDRLWNAALQDLPEDERFRTYTIIQKKLIVPKGEKSIISLWMQTKISDSQSHDDPRGSFFILYDRDKQAIVYSTFGHVEWAVGSKIEYVRPYLWFKLGNDPRILILAEHKGAYEDTSSGWAIIEHTTGALVSHSK